MTDRQWLLRAARLLREGAEVVRDSNIIKAKGHPRIGQFDTDLYGRIAKKDFDKLSHCAENLLRIAKE